MNIIFDQRDLPDKINIALSNKKILSGGFVFSIKTLYKPNATVPILWFTVIDDGIVFLNSHKTRNVFLEINKKSINSIRLYSTSSKNLIEIISNDIYEKNFVIPVPQDIKLDTIKSNLIKNGYSISS